MGKSKTIKCAEYDDLVAGVEAARQKVRTAGKAAVAALFKSFFAEYPKVKAVGWEQYAPHFNDGDPCVFRVHEPYLSTEDADFSEVSHLYGEAGFKESYELDGPLRTALNRIDASLNEEILEAAFGDDAMVIATPAGFHVSECVHD
jgi:predicted nuclease of predicted toxin-antitoxin system